MLMNFHSEVAVVFARRKSNVVFTAAMTAYDFMRTLFRQVFPLRKLGWSCPTQALDEPSGRITVPSITLSARYRFWPCTINTDIPDFTEYLAAMVALCLEYNAATSSHSGYISTQAILVFFVYPQLPVPLKEKSRFTHLSHSRKHSDRISYPFDFGFGAAS